MVNPATADGLPEQCGHRTERHSKAFRRWHDLIDRLWRKGGTIGEMMAYLCRTDCMKLFAWAHRGFVL